MWHGSWRNWVGSHISHVRKEALKGSDPLLPRPSALKDEGPLAWVPEGRTGAEMPDDPMIDTRHKPRVILYFHCRKQRYKTWGLSLQQNQAQLGWWTSTTQLMPDKSTCTGKNPSVLKSTFMSLYSRTAHQHTGAWSSALNSLASWNSSEACRVREEHAECSGLQTPWGPPLQAPDFVATAREGKVVWQNLPLASPSTHLPPPEWHYSRFTQAHCHQLWEHITQPHAHIGLATGWSSASETEADTSSGSLWRKSSFLSFLLPEMQMTATLEQHLEPGDHTLRTAEHHGKQETGSLAATCTHVSLELLTPDLYVRVNACLLSCHYWHVLLESELEPLWYRQALV